MKTTAAIVTLLLSGCATIAIPVPNETGPRIIVLRDNGAVGSACKAIVKVDDKIVAELSAGQSYSAAVNPGQHRVSVGGGGGLCGSAYLTRIADVKESPVVFRLGNMGIANQVIFDRIQ